MTRATEPTDLERALALETGPAAPGSDDELVEFALGELDEESAERVRQRLVRDPEAARKVLDLKASFANEPPAGEAPLSAAEMERAWGQLEAARSSDGGNKPRSSIQNRPSAAPRRRFDPYWKLAACLLLVLGGVSAVWLWPDPSTEITLRAEARHERGEEPPADAALPTLGPGRAKLRLLLAGLELGRATRFEVCFDPEPSPPSCLPARLSGLATAPLAEVDLPNQKLSAGVYQLKVYEWGRRVEPPLAEYRLRVSAAP